MVFGALDRSIKIDSVKGASSHVAYQRMATTLGGC